MTTNGGDSETDAQADWLSRAILEAADATGIGVTLTVADGALKNVYANPAADALFGYPPGGLVKADPLAIVDSMDRQRFTELSEQFMLTGSFPPTVETTVTQASGRSTQVEVGLGGTTMEGRMAVVAFIADATQRNGALESLRRSEARFRSVVETIPEAIFITDGTRLVYANPAFCTAFGVERSHLDDGLDVLDLVHPDDARKLAEAVRGLSLGGVAHIECRMQPRAGTEMTLEASAIGVDLDHRLRVLFLGQDVTERKKLESKLLQADRLGVLGSLAAGMAHSINNPLSYTLLNLEHVARRMRDIGTEHDYYSEARVRLAEAHDGAERIAKIVRQMRILSRSRPSEPGPIDLRAVLESVLAMVGNEIRYRGQLVTRLDLTPRVWASEGELEQAFLGLLLYVARSASEKGPGAREIRLSTSVDDEGNGVVTVSDDGLVLDEPERRRLFDPFGGSDATGFGLAVCQSILKSVEGRIDVEYHPDGGTVFRVTLPPASAKGAPESRRREPARATVAPPPMRDRARVLVIDDDPGVASTLRAMLEAHHEIRSVTHGREGLRLLLGPEDFDIVFCDLIMPEVSGIDVFCAVELNRPDRVDRIVFMTGGVFTAEAEKFLARVPNPRVEKPFSLARVDQLLAQAVEKRARAATPDDATA
ncbi:MAG TPA: PAS domain S-box protein [Polyangiaceae bacterium]|nr:PAS domain S-box protein [Polyangiaceae bacterium]